VDPNGRIVVEEVHDEGIGRNASELLRKVQAAQFVASNPGMVCPAKWAPGKDALKVSIDLVGKI
jgi:peroxiredoxin (alkyl hydroperoxide reductase subunit C)